MYVDSMYAAWKDDPSSVHVSWHAYFAQVDAGVDPRRHSQRRRLFRAPLRRPLGPLRASHSCGGDTARCCTSSRPTSDAATKSEPRPAGSRCAVISRT